MWITNVLEPLIAFGAALALAWVIGQWGRMRRIERLAEVAQKMPDSSVARRGLETRAEREAEALIRKLDTRLPPLLAAALMVVGLVWILFFTTGILVIGWRGPTFDDLFMGQVVNLQQRYGLSISKAVTVGILGNVTTLIIIISLEVVGYYALRWALPRGWRLLRKRWTARRVVVAGKRKRHVASATAPPPATGAKP